MTSVDVDDYQVKAAAERLASVGLHPNIAVCDATGPLPGSYDRIVSMMSVRPLPGNWLAALRPGGRLVTVLPGHPLPHLGIVGHGVGNGFGCYGGGWSRCYRRARRATM